MPELGSIGKRDAVDGGDGEAERQVGQTERKRRRSVEVGRCRQIWWRSSAGRFAQFAIDQIEIWLQCIFVK